MTRKVVEHDMKTARTFSVAVGLMSLNQQLGVWCILGVLDGKCNEIAVYGVCINP